MAIATRTLENFIGGRWVPSEADRTIDDVNPADPDDVLARVPLSSLEEAEAAIAAAADAFPAWKAMSPVRRGQMLVRASKILEERQEEVARLITREQGKTLAEARAEVPRAIQFWGWMGYQGGSIQGITAPTESDELMALTLREPLGVVSLITPWNFPINIPGWKVASALVCGNTVVLDLHARPAAGDAVRTRDRHRRRPHQQAAHRGGGAPSLRWPEAVGARPQGARRRRRVLHADEDRLPRLLVNKKEIR